MAIRAGRLYPFLVILILAGAVAIRVADPFFVQALRLIAFDSYQRLAPETYDPALPVRVVDIDEESLQRIGQWPWPRDIVADLLKRLAGQGAAVVVFDVLFAEPDQTSPTPATTQLSPEGSDTGGVNAPGSTSHDEIFAQAISDSAVVLATVLSNRPAPPPPPKAGFAVAGDDPRPFIPEFAGATGNVPILDAAAVGIGSINWTPDRDQVIRRVPLIFRVGEDFVPTLAPEALRVALGASTYVLKASNASGETAFGQETGLNHIKIGDIDVPTDADGGIWLKFRPSKPDAYLKAWRVLEGEDFSKEVEGRILLIGTSAAGLVDLRATPIDAAIAGVEVHAQAIEHILTGRSLARPDYALAAELATVLVLGLVLAVVLPRISARLSALLGVLAIVVVIAAGWFAYTRANLLFDPSYPVLALFALVAAATLYVYRRVELQRAEVRLAFSHYVSPAVVDEIIANPERLELGGQLRDLTLLFCDVRNFTSISERMSATELTRFINSLLTPLTDIILSNRGTIDKYMGDAIMAFWNAPLDDADHAAHACKSAREMALKMGDLNRQWREEAQAAGRVFVPVAIGIGVNSGECLVGNLGSDQRFDYSALGDEVNVASRLEGLTKMYGMATVIGEPTVRRNPGLPTLELDLMRVKGRSRPSRIYTLSETLGADKETLDRLTPLQEAMLEAFRSKDWDRAEALIGECCQLHTSALETYYRIYSARIGVFRVDPPPDDWDGAVTADTK
jgi:adenylate cyclase